MAAFDFPNSPSSGDKFPATPVAGQPQYTWDGEKWTTIGGTTIASAPATAIPLPNGVGAVGVSIKYAREDHVHPADTARVALAGDTMTGPLGLPDLKVLATGPSSQGWITWYRDGLARWGALLNSGPDTGGNVGSDFVIGRFTDAGSYIDAPIAIQRSTGKVTVNSDPASALGVATKQYVDNNVAYGDSLRVAKSGDTMSGVLTLNAGQTVNVTGYIGTGGPNGFLVQGGGQPCISFLIPGVFGGNLGMDSAGNFYTGGWSFGANYKIWTTRDFQSPWTPAHFPNPGYPVQYVRLAYAGDYDNGPQGSVGQNALDEIYYGAVITHIAPYRTRTNDDEWYLVTVTARYRYLQVWTANYGGYVTVGYA